MIAYKSVNQQNTSLEEREDILHRQGKVTLVGFGPGDPELLTVKAVKALQNADIIFYDDLIGKDFLDTLSAEKYYVGKRSGCHHAEQDDINRLLLKAAREGKEVVRLKGGDPMVFGHAGEEIEYLQSNLIEVSVIPGITTASALAATTKVSLTQRGISSSVSFVNGHSARPIVPNTETIIYYMGGVDNWILASFDNGTSIDYTQNYAYQTLATNMRGFRQNIRNGNNFVVLNSELRFPVFSYFMDRPINMKFIKDFQIVAFGDLGTAWTGWNPYDPSNSLYNTQISDGNLDITVTELKEPLVGGIGFGLRTTLLGYFIRGDVAWGIQDGQIAKKPRYYVSFNLDF